ncbi:MAG: chaperone modulator CbpM [Ginsengibacter sp.]
MKTEDLVPAKDFCLHHNIEYSFISSLQNSGLIEVTTIRRSSFIHTDDLQKLEKFVRLHYDLEINVEGIETINHLLDRIEEMQREIVRLKNSLPNLRKNRDSLTGGGA